MHYGNCVQDRIETFDSMHGASVNDDHWIYFEDGARREMEPTGALQEPPKDPRHLHENIVYYHMIRLKRATQDFDNFKEILLENPGMHPDRDQNLADLRALKAEAEEIRETLLDAQEELKKVSPGYRTPEEEDEYLAQMAATEAAKAEYVSALNSINI